MPLIEHEDPEPVGVCGVGWYVPQVVSASVLSELYPVYVIGSSCRKGGQQVAVGDGCGGREPMGSLPWTRCWAWGRSNC